VADELGERADRHGGRHESTKKSVAALEIGTKSAAGS
jgi:hypothetical protein